MLHNTKVLIDRRVSAWLITGDLLALFFAYFIAKMSEGALSLGGAHLSPHGHYLFLFICPIILYACLRKGHYTRREPWWSQVRFLFFACLTALFVDLSVRFLFQVPLSDILLSLGWVYGFFFILLARQICCYALKRAGYWNIETIIIGTNDTIVNLLFAFNNDYYTGYKVKVVLLRDDKQFDLSVVPEQYKGLEILDVNKDYANIINEYSQSYFVICLDTFRGEDRDNLITHLTDLDVLYSVVPPISSMRLFEMRPQNFFGSDVMLLQSRNVSGNLIGKIVKRIMDASLAFLALIVLSPIFLAVMICQKREGQSGSLFYGGERIGKGDKKFKCWKFRSMEPNTDHLLQELLANDPKAKEEWETYHKLRADPRVQTKTSRIMRKTSIDELPQLWSVIKGDMSLVGPRPILESEKEMFGNSLKNYIKVRPGISGLWQVSGRNDTSFQRRVVMDDWYVRNASIWGDITIIFKTVKVVLQGSGM